MARPMAVNAMATVRFTVLVTSTRPATRSRMSRARKKRLSARPARSQIRAITNSGNTIPKT